LEKSQELIALDFYKSCGYDDASIKRYLERVNLRKTLVTPLNRGYKKIENKDTVLLGNIEWEIVIAKGHSPEHVCLYSKENNIFICGDVLLPRITPNISVRPFHAETNPLFDWIKSLKEIKERIPDDALILPSHGYPYYGAHKRIDAIIEDHMNKIETLFAFCKEPKNVIEVFPALFVNKINENSLILAVGESLAHLNYLIGEDKMKMKKNNEGINYYQSI
jgi:glyoxylase-like metal-dependent hydrolase (beta-lactamase superfamily II)